MSIADVLTATALPNVARVAPRRTLAYVAVFVIWAPILQPFAWMVNSFKANPSVSSVNTAVLAVGGAAGVSVNTVPAASVYQKSYE